MARYIVLLSILHISTCDMILNMYLGETHRLHVPKPTLNTAYLQRYSRVDGWSRNDNFDVSLTYQNSTSASIDISANDLNSSGIYGLNFNSSNHINIRITLNISPMNCTYDRLSVDGDNIDAIRFRCVTSERITDARWLENDEKIGLLGESLYSVTSFPTRSEHGSGTITHTLEIKICLTKIKYLISILEFSMKFDNVTYASANSHFNIEAQVYELNSNVGDRLTISCRNTSDKIYVKRFTNHTQPWRLYGVRDGNSTLHLSNVTDKDGGMYKCSSVSFDRILYVRPESRLEFPKHLYDDGIETKLLTYNSIPFDLDYMDLLIYGSIGICIFVIIVLVCIITLVKR